jgi:putative ABC transport system permease protein
LFRFLPILDRKLLRELWRLRGPALAIALVIGAGVGMVLMSYGMMRSLEATRDAYYDRYRFADVFAPAKRAPESLMADIARLPGVSIAESRVSAAAMIDLPGMAEPANARLHSLPISGRPRLNDLVLREGRWPDPARPEEILANEAFVKAARLRPGDTIAAILNGKRQTLRIVGVVLSPEYVYAIPPGQIFPDNRRFAVLWLGRKTLAGAFDLTDAFNEVVIRVQRGVAAADVLRRLDMLLAPYGGTGAYSREDQISDRFVTNELSQLRTMTGILPPIFLAVAAFLTHLVLGRLIDTEREVIGLMKAFGYRNGAIAIHYLKLGLLLSAGGFMLGSALGIWLGRGLARMYQAFFAFPFLQFRIGPDVFALSALVALLAVLFGSIQAIRRVTAMRPADAMRPPIPASYSGPLARAIARLRSLDELTRIVLRGFVRRPFRSLAAATGIASALALYIASAGSTDNVERMIDLTFDRAEREDMLLTFVEPRPASALHALTREPGVMRVEPMRAVSARFTAGRRSKREPITAAAPSADLSRLIDLDGNPVEPPPAGLMISAGLARDLDIGVGDNIDVEIMEGRRPRLREPVFGVVESPVGSPSFKAIASLNHAMMEGDSVSGAYMQIDSHYRDSLFRRLKQMPMVAGVTLLEASRRGLRETIAENMGIVTLFNTGFSALIVFGVIYNNARISLAERARDFASMRVLGFRRGEVSYLLIAELALLTLIALPIGIPLGIALSRYMVSKFSGDLYSIPYALGAGTIARAALVVIIASALTSLIVRRRLDRLDLVAVLKTRD